MYELFIEQEQVSLIQKSSYRMNDNIKYSTFSSVNFVSFSSTLKAIKTNFSRSKNSYHWIRRASSLQNSHEKISSRDRKEFRVAYKWVRSAALNLFNSSFESWLRIVWVYIPGHKCLTKWCLSKGPSAVVKGCTIYVYNFLAKDKKY